MSKMKSKKIAEFDFSSIKSSKKDQLAIENDQEKKELEVIFDILQFQSYNLRMNKILPK